MGLPAPVPIQAVRGLVIVLLAVALGACRQSPSPEEIPLLRIGSLVAPPEGDRVELAAGFTLHGGSRVMEVSIDAARIARLRLHGRGTATLARLSWRLAGEKDFRPYRTVSFSLVPDGEEHLYEVNLQREPYWMGKVAALRLSVAWGVLEVTSLTGEPAPTPFRNMALRGKHLPSLPGVARMEVSLPEGVPRQAVFETHLGLLPQYDHQGVEARFRVYVEGPGRDAVWIEHALHGGDPERNRRWVRVRRRVEVPSRSRLVLEAQALRHGKLLPEGVALWGNPLLFRQERPPGHHLLVVLIDTLRADALGAYGNRDGLTPHLDRLADRSVRFAQLYAPSPWTLPSVASLMTGLHPQTHGAGRRIGDFAPVGLGASTRTLAEVLAGEGLYTVALYHNIYLAPAFGLQQGFDEYVSHEERAGFLVDRALERLESYRNGRRLFLYLHLFDPHNPYSPPQEVCREVTRGLAPDYRGEMGCSGDRRPGNPLPPPEDRPWLKALYHAEVAYVDRELGRLLAGLQELGLEDETVVLVVSDHGESFWERLEQEEEYGYEVGCDHGHAHYQELLRVPGILRAPGLPPAVVEDAVELVDLFPTLLKLLEVEPPRNQGRDLTAVLAGERPVPPPLMSAFLLHGPPRWAIRRGPWKLVMSLEEGLPGELYNLDEDPGERVNLLASRPTVVTGLETLRAHVLRDRVRLRRQLQAADEPMNATFLEWNHITKLRALGYLR